MINTAKLNELRESHERRRDLYAGLSARVRKAKADAVQLRSFNPAMAATPAQKEMISRVLAFPPAELLALPAETLATIGLTPAMINAGLDAQRHADSLQKEADAMLSELHSSGALLTRLNDWVRANT